MSKEYKFCPYCGANFQGEPIPEEHKHHYQEGATHYGRLINVYDVFKDRGVAWRCPDCGEEWDKEYMSDDRTKKLLDYVVFDAERNGFTKEDLGNFNLLGFNKMTRSPRVLRMIRLAYYRGEGSGIKMVRDLGMSIEVR